MPSRTLHEGIPQAMAFVRFRLAAACVALFSEHWIAWAFTIAVMRPGKRCSISSQRVVLCISTPRRSPRMRPASRRALKCCERVDLGIAFSLTFRKFEQLCEHAEPAI